MKMMEGDWARAWANRSLTRAGPTPTNISMKSEPAIDRKGTFASPAVALAAHSTLLSQTCHATVSQKQSAHHPAKWRPMRRQVLYRSPLQSYPGGGAVHTLTAKLTSPAAPDWPDK